MNRNIYLHGSRIYKLHKLFEVSRKTERRTSYAANYH